MDKYARAHMALDKGVDLVIEIPSIFAGQTAEIFARGGLLSLNSLDCVDSFCFGSEDGNIDRLTSLASFIYDQADWIDQRARDLMKGSLSFARAREEAIKEVCRNIHSSFCSSVNSTDSTSCKNFNSCHFCTNHCCSNSCCSI